MRKSGEEFFVVYGLYKGKPHCWIEHNGKKLDPSVCNNKDEFYEEIYSAYYAPMEKRKYLAKIIENVKDKKVSKIMLNKGPLGVYTIVGRLKKNEETKKQTNYPFH